MEDGGRRSGPAEDAALCLAQRLRQPDRPVGSALPPARHSTAATTDASGRTAVPSRAPRRRRRVTILSFDRSNSVRFFCFVLRPVSRSWSENNDSKARPVTVYQATYSSVRALPDTYAPTTTIITYDAMQTVYTKRWQPDPPNEIHYTVHTCTRNSRNTYVCKGMRSTNWAMITSVCQSSKEMNSTYCTLSIHYSIRYAQTHCCAKLLRRMKRHGRVEVTKKKPKNGSRFPIPWSSGSSWKAVWVNERKYF